MRVSRSVGLVSKKVKIDVNRDYFYKGKWHQYIPDLRINYIDETVDIWEIKPANQTHYEQTKAKWSAMNEHVKKHGWRFTVITEVGIDKLKTKVKKQTK